MNMRMLRTGAAVAAVALLFAAGCGDDNDSEPASESDDKAAAEPASADPASSASGEVADYCEAVLAIETAPEPEIDFESASEEEIATALKSFAADTMRPLVDDAIAVAPAELESDIAMMDGAVDEMASSGDFAVFEQPDVAAASDRLHDFDLANCGWTTQEVQAHEYKFEGLPEQLDAGVVSFEFSNHGQELHELLLFRKNDGVTESAEELLALPEDEAMQKVTMAGVPAMAGPGGDDYKVVDLERGEYVALCFIPIGTTGEDPAAAGSGAPHFTQGMATEFSVK